MKHIKLKYAVYIPTKQIPGQTSLTNNTGNKSGFTLIELLIVLLILVVALGLAGILVNRGSGNLELKTFTKHMATTLRYARNQAISEKKVHSFIFSDDKNTYGLYADIFFDKDPEAETALVYKTIPESLTVTFENKDEYKRIDFYPRGISSGGKISISNQKNKRFFIIVNRLTGNVEIQKDDNS
jgi:prepilin-type N-terminal cleavage/methylation domain-containing protein